MSKLKVPTAASKWNHNILSSIGIGLEPHLQDYVNENIQGICDIGLLNEKRFDAARWVENNVMTRYPREELAVDRFAKMSVQVGGETVSANPDIVVSNTSTNVILIVQEDKSLLSETRVNNESVAKIKKTRKKIDDMLINASYYCPHNSMNEVGYLRTKQEYLLESLQCFEAMRQMAI